MLVVNIADRLGEAMSYLLVWFFDIIDWLDNLIIFDIGDFRISLLQFLVGLLVIFIVTSGIVNTINFSKNKE